ncbi:MAG: hypothetical protein AB3N06_04795 [Erythrobacter sp.]
MPHDDILAEVGADWKRQTIDHGRLLAHVERRRRRIRLVFAIKVAGAAIALLASIWFIGLALAGEALAFGLAGFILLAALPLMVMELIETRRLTRAGSNIPPEGALHAARDQSMASLRLLWAPRVGAIFLAACALGLVLLHVGGKASAGDAATIAPVWLITALATWLWQSRRGQRLKAEIERCDRMLDELGEGGAA